MIHRNLRYIKCFTVVIFIMLLSVGCSKPQENKVSDTKVNDTNVNNIKPVETKQEKLYASDSNASDLAGYTQLLSKYAELQAGTKVDLEYDFTCKEYEQLLQKYDLKKIAGNGSEFERAVRLMDCFSSRLEHKSDYDNHVEDNSLALLEYSLDNKEQGINGRAKTKILNEMCLALGIYARRVWLMPYSSEDQDCNVVTEIYDNTYKKWIMLDMTSDCYFINEKGTPLSILELRKCGATNQSCTAINSKFKGNFAEAISNEEFAYLKPYFMKNMFYYIILPYNGFGSKQNEKEYDIVPTGYDVYQRDIANLKYRLEIATDQKMDQKVIDGMKKSLDYLQKNNSYYVIMSPDVMEEKPEVVCGA